MAMLRRIGQLASVLLDDQMKREYAAYQSGLVKDRQEEVYSHNKNLSALSSLGGLIDKTRQDPRSHPSFGKLPEDIQAQMIQRYEMQPGDEQVKAEAFGDTNKSIASAATPEALGTLGGRFEEERNAAHAKGAPINLTDVTNLANTFNSKADVIANADVTKRERDIRDEAAKKLLPGPSKKLGVVKYDKNGTPVASLVPDENRPGQFRAATAEEMQQPNMEYQAGHPQEPPFGLTTLQNTKEDAAAIFEGIKAGNVAPDPAGLSRNGTWAEVSKLAAQDGFNLMDASKSWKATVAAVRGMNSNQQLRLGQTLQTADDTLDRISELNAKWNGASWGPLSAAQLALAKSGSLGQDASIAANALDAQITDMAMELATVYQGGNTPTDQARNLASKNLQAWWGKGTVDAMIAQAKANIRIRQGAMQDTLASAPGGFTVPGGNNVQPNAMPTDPVKSRYVITVN